MADEQVSARLQVPIKLIHQSLLGRPIEIDHYVPTKDTVKGFVEAEGSHEVKTAKPDMLFQRVFNLYKILPIAFPFQKVFFEQVMRDGLGPVSMK